MSTKFHLVRDRDRDGFFPALKRHAAVFLVVVLTLCAVVAVVIGSYTVGVVKRNVEQQRLAEQQQQRIEANDAKFAERQRLAEQQRAEAAEARVAAAAQLAKGDVPVHKATVSGTTQLRAGPGSHYDVVGVVRTGLEVGVVARTYPDKWYLLDDGLWIKGAYLSGSFATLLEIDPPLETDDDCRLLAVDC